MRPQNARRCSGWVPRGAARPSGSPVCGRRPTCSQPLQRLAAPYCGATIWRSGLWRKAPLLQQYKKIIAVADKVDTATDVAALVLAALSVGSLTAPAAAVKLVAKYGKHRLKKVIKDLEKATRATKSKKVSVRLKVNCVWGFIPYPGVGIYT